LIDVHGWPVLRIPTHGWRFPLPSLQDTLAVFWLLSQIGVEQVIVDASVGGISVAPWDVVVPDDVILTEETKLAMPRLGREVGRTAWVRMANPFCPRVRGALVAAYREVTHENDGGASAALRQFSDKGLYYTTPLSVFETAAEIRFAKSIGGTVVGQSTGQEAAAARVCGMCFGVINPVANYAEGLAGGTWIEGGMGAFYDAIALPMAQVVYNALQRLVAQERTCGCADINEAANVARLVDGA
jgi:purine nucleoside phosphorylase